MNGFVCFLSALFFFHFLLFIEYCVYVRKSNIVSNRPNICSFICLGINQLTSKLLCYVRIIQTQFALSSLLITEQFLDKADFELSHNYCLIFEASPNIMLQKANGFGLTSSLSLSAQNFKR